MKVWSSEEVEIIKVVTGLLEENCYVIKDKKNAISIVIDPGDDGEKIADAIGNFEVKYILLTHAHFDHVGALKYLKENFGGEILMHKGDLALLENASLVAGYFGISVQQPPPPDNFVEDGDIITAGNLKIKVIHVPGHSPGGVAYYMDSGEKHLFTGDILFAGSVGRTDLPGGNWNLLISGIKQKLLVLPPETIVYPGHGPETTIGREKVSNPFILFS